MPLLLLVNGAQKLYGKESNLWTGIRRLHSGEQLGVRVILASEYISMPSPSSGQPTVHASCVC